MGVFEMKGFRNGWKCLKWTVCIPNGWERSVCVLNHMYVLKTTRTYWK